MGGMKIERQNDCHVRSVTSSSAACDWQACMKGACEVMNVGIRSRRRALLLKLDVTIMLFELGRHAQKQRASVSILTNSERSAGLVPPILPACNFSIDVGGKADAGIAAQSALPPGQPPPEVELGPPSELLADAAQLESSNKCRSPSRPGPGATKRHAARDVHTRTRFQRCARRSSVSRSGGVGREGREAEEDEGKGSEGAPDVAPSAATSSAAAA